MKNRDKNLCNQSIIVKGPPYVLVVILLIPGLLLIGAVGMITLYTANRVTRSKYHVPRSVTVFEFPDVCRYFLGPAGELVAGIFGVLSFLGALLAYWVYMSTFLYSIGDFIHGQVCKKSFRSGKEF